MRRLRAGALLSARDLSLLLERQDRIAAGLWQRDDLYLQRHAAHAGPLCDRLCDIAGRGVDDDQHRRLRPRQDKDWAGRPARLQAERKRPAGAYVYAGLTAFKE